MDGRTQANKARVRAPLDRFWQKVDRRSGECWLWTGSTNDKNYGRFWNGRRVVPAHRWAYEHFVGAMAEGHEPDHLCRNHRCVNPDHLEAVTHRVNSQRAAYSQERCARGHVLPPPNKSGRRVCRPCANARSRAHRAKAIYEAVMS